MTRYANIETNYGAPYPDATCAVCGAECPQCSAARRQTPKGGRMTTDPSSDVVERLPDDMFQAGYDEFHTGLHYGSVRSQFQATYLAMRALDPTIERLSAELERAFREGWAKGYRAGVIDGGSDSSWCDEEGDWQNSETRAALSNTAENG